MTTLTNTTVNGIHVQELGDAMNAIQLDPAKGMTQWCTKTSWCGGARSDTMICHHVIGGETVRKVLASPGGAFDGALGAVVFQVYDRSTPPVPALPGVHLDQVGAAFYAAPLLSGGLVVDMPVPLGVAGGVLRAQGFALSSSAQNGAYATTFAHDVFLH